VEGSVFVGDLMIFVVSGLVGAKKTYFRRKKSTPPLDLPERPFRLKYFRQGI